MRKSPGTGLLVLFLFGCAGAQVGRDGLSPQNTGEGEKVIQSASGSVSAVVPDGNSWQTVERLAHSFKIEPANKPLSIAAAATYLGPDEESLSVADLLRTDLEREQAQKIQWHVTEQGPALLGGHPATRLSAQAMIGQTVVITSVIGRRAGQRLCVVQLMGMSALVGMAMASFDRAVDTFRCVPPTGDVPKGSTGAAELGTLAMKSIDDLDPSRAVALLVRAVEKDPANEDLTDKLVQSSLLVGDASRALRVLKGELARDPERFAHWKTLAQLQYQLGDAEGGLATLKTAVARPGAPAALFATLGEGYLRAEDYPSAEAAFSKAIEKDPKGPAAYAALGDTYFHERKLAEAEKSIEKAISLDPGRAEYHVALSEVFGELKLDEKAIEECIAALERGVGKPLEGTLKYNLACFSARLGRERDCLFWLRQAFEAGFNDVEFMRKDPDLATVRDLPAFKEMFELGPAR